MKTVIFDLSMPNNNSWNGKWSGEGNRFCITKRLKDSKADELNGDSFYYNFGDGWGASVSCKISDSAAETRKAKKESRGFCGYEWMANEVVWYGEIRGSRRATA